jgi:methyl-accepting chemotaxis protein
MLSLITLRQKLLIATVALSIPIFYLGYLMVASNLESIDKRQTELKGLEYQTYIRPIVKGMSDHRNQTASFLDGDESYKSKIADSALSVDQAITNLINFDQQWRNEFNTKKYIDSLSGTWDVLKTENLELRKRESFDKHSNLISQTLHLSDQIAINTGLTLDPDANISYLSNLTTKNIPRLREEVAKLRATSTAIATRQYLEDGENLTVLSYQIGVRDNKNSTSVLFDRVFSENPEFENAMKENLELLSSSIDVVIENSQFLVTDIAGLMQAQPGKYSEAGSLAIENSILLEEQVIQNIKMLLTDRIAAMKSKLYFSAIISIALFVFACFFNLMFAREVNKNFAKAIHVFDEIKKGKYENEIEVKGNTEFSKIFSSLLSMQKELNDSVQKDRELAEHSGRINLALDKVSAGVMMVDEDLNVIYTNQSVVDILGEAEHDIQRELPDFDSQNMMGVNIDMFHKDPSHQRNLLADLKHSHKAEIEIGGRTLVINANPVFNQDNEKIGTVVEWSDRTQELSVISEVQSLVENASMGNLSERIDLSNKEGFYKRLSTGMNELVDVSERVINDTLRVLSAMTQGNLNETINEDYQGVYEQLKNDTNTVIDKLKEVVINIKSSSDTVGTAAKEISQGNNNLSQRTEEQAASLEETSSSMEEMTSTVQQNADNAQQANQLALNAREQAENGGKVVTTAIDAMNEINTSSKKIADIISVIDEIAFQTNLLALNASVEAARAGEQGRGFAVVASEVRNLAGRSATAAKEIKELIEDSVSKVGEGSKLVNKSGETLDEIVNSVKKVTDIIAEISASSQEQASGIDEVNKAVLQMDENTQQNAALVEQAAAASQSMNQEANELTKQIGFFKVGKQDVSVNEINPIVKEERRSANRPWKQEAVKQVQTPTQNVKKVSGSDVDEQEWQEF